MPDPKLPHLVFDKYTPAAAAIAEFVRRYGVAPHDVFVDGPSSYLWVGPVPQVHDEPQQLELI
jgi:hypothetical protein